MARDVVFAFQVALVEDAARQTYAVDDHVAGEAFARRCAAQSAVDLRQAGLEPVDAFHFFEGLGAVFVEDEHRARLRGLDAAVFEQVVLHLVHCAVARHLAVALAFGGFACAGVHAGSAQETVLVAQQGTGAALVAGAEFEEFDIFDLVVLQLVEEVHHVLYAVDGVALLGQADASLAVGEGAEDGVARQVDGAAGFRNVVLALLLDFAVGAVEERVHIDHAVDDGTLLADGGLDGGYLGGAGGDVEEANLFARDATVLQLLQAVDGRKVEGGLDGHNVLGQRGILDLYQPDDGGAEAGNERTYVGVFASVAFLGLGKEVGCRFDLEDVAEAEVLEGVVDSRHAYLFGELSQEDGWNEGHGVWKLVHHLEVVLVDVDGVDGTGFVALAAVDAAVLLYVCCAFADAYGLGGAGLKASHAADAFFVVYFERVYEHVFGD